MSTHTSSHKAASSKEPTGEFTAASARPGGDPPQSSTTTQTNAENVTTPQTEDKLAQATPEPNKVGAPARPRYDFAKNRGGDVPESAKDPALGERLYEAYAASIGGETPSWEELKTIDGKQVEAWLAVADEARR